MDVGTGSGILAIGAAMLGAENVLAVDIDPIAVKVAQENIAHNHLENRITAVTGNLLEGIDGQCEVCVANIIADIICIFAEPVVSILYGEAYLPAVKPLRIITWYTAFSYLGVARNTWIVCEEKQRYLSAVYVASAVVNVALNALLIPKMGASGAALASVAAQIMTVTLAPLFIKALRPNVRMMADAILLKGIKSK